MGSCLHIRRSSRTGSTGSSAGVARLVRDQEVGGSIPPCPTYKDRSASPVGLFLFPGPGGIDREPPPSEGEEEPPGTAAEGGEGGLERADRKSANGRQFPLARLTKDRSASPVGLFLFLRVQFLDHRLYGNILYDEIAKPEGFGDEADEGGEIHDRGVALEYYVRFGEAGEKRDSGW